MYNKKALYVVQSRTMSLIEENDIRVEQYTSMSLMNSKWLYILYSLYRCLSYTTNGHTCCTQQNCLSWTTKGQSVHAVYFVHSVKAIKDANFLWIDSLL